MSKTHVIEYKTSDLKVNDEGIEIPSTEFPITRTSQSGINARVDLDPKGKKLLITYQGGNLPPGPHKTDKFYTNSTTIIVKRE